jgi:hypothetical protein
MQSKKVEILDVVCVAGKIIFVSIYSVLQAAHPAKSTTY